MAEAVNVFSQGYTLTHNGEKYTVSPLNLEMLAVFEAWCEEVAFRKVERSKGKVSAEIYEGRLNAIANLVSSGAFAVGGRLAWELAQSRAGQRYLFHLQITLKHGGLDEDETAQIFDACQSEIFAKSTQAPSDPNPRTPTV